MRNNIRNNNKSYEHVWAECLDFIRDNITPEQFNASFAFVEFNSFDDGKLLLNVPSNFIKELLEEQYMNLMRSAFTKHFGQIKGLYYKIQTDSTNHISVQEQSEGRQRVVNAAPRNDARTSPDDVTAPQVQDLDSQLRSSYNLENFVEGESNRLAYSVANAIAKNPAETFNPFFVYGHSGVGKTHLVNAIGVRIKELHPQLRVLYISAHLFTVQYTDAVIKNKTTDFIRFYQSIDVLIIDDIQELSGKEKTQNTFFHIFNHLQVNKKQIILTADRPPMAIEGFEERLLTRFKWGLQTEIEKPTQSMRYDILNAKIDKEGLQIPPHIVRYISEHVSESVRDLEGVLNSLMAHSICFNCDIDMALVERVLPGFVQINDSPVTIEEIKQSVCQHFRLTIEVLDSSTRKQEVAYARQMAMYLATQLTSESNVQIGRRIGNRNHATVIHACKQIKNLLDVDENTGMDVETIKDMIRASR